MPLRSEKISFNAIKSAVFFGLIILLGVGMLFLIGPFIYPIFWAAVIATLFYPIYNWLATHTGMKRASSFMTILIVIALLFLPLLFIAALVVNQSIDLYNKASETNVRESIEVTTNWLLGTPVGPYVQELQSEWASFASNAGRTIASFLFTNARAFTENSIRFIFLFFIMLYTLFYFFTDGPRMLKRLMYLTPIGDKYEKMLYEKFTSAARATLKSTILIGGIQGTLGGLLFWWTGVPSPFIWGVIMVIVAILPALGAPLVIVPAAIVQFFLGNIWQAIALLVGALIISFIDNILRPPLVGHDIQMHPLIVLFTTLGGLAIFGVSGFVIGPIIAALFLAIMQIYDHYYRKELSRN